MSFRCVHCGTRYPQRVKCCWRCWAFGSVMVEGVRPPAEIDAEPELATARELVRRAWTTVDVSAVAPELQLSRGALMVLYGGPGAGKSTLALRLADAVGCPVVVLSAEERLGAAVAGRLQRVGIRREDVHIMGASQVDALVAQVRRAKAKVLVIDSMQATSLLPEDLRGLLTRLDLDLLIATAQVTKEGAPRGTHALLHEADVVLQLTDDGWTVEKTRYGATGATGAVYAD